jgi:hypothetical protein
MELTVSCNRLRSLSLIGSSDLIIRLDISFLLGFIATLRNPDNPNYAATSLKRSFRTPFWLFSTLLSWPEAVKGA